MKIGDFDEAPCGSWILRPKKVSFCNLKACKGDIVILRQEEERKRREVEKQENWDFNDNQPRKKDSPGVHWIFFEDNEMHIVSL